MIPKNKNQPEEKTEDKTSLRTLRIRIKDKHKDFLRSLAFDVNQVWNFCNELSIKVFERERRFMSGFDLQKYTDGCSKEGLKLHSQTVQAIASEYATRRKQFKKVRLAWPRAAVHPALWAGSHSKKLVSPLIMARSGMARPGFRSGIVTA
jgi:hypothetical protein